MIGSKNYLYFGGTNYLGLAHHPELIEAAQKVFAEFGFSSGASRLTSGENEILLSLESELAEFAEVEAALTLPAGFMSNQAVIDGLDDEVDLWVISIRAHASIRAAVKRTRKEVIEVEDLYDAKLSLRHDFDIPPDQNIGVFAEPIDALTGRVNRIDHLVKKAWAQDFIIIDEAQSFGVLGSTGRGAFEYFKVGRGHNLIRTGTFSKAIGTYGGFVLAAQKVVDLIKSRSEAYRGSTSMPPLLCAATRAALRLIHYDPKNTVVRLHENIEFLNQLLNKSKLVDPPDESDPYSAQASPIYYVLAFEDVSVKRMELFDKMICLPSMSNYFLGIKEMGLRFTIQSGHSRDDLQRLLRALTGVS